MNPVRRLSIKNKLLLIMMTTTSSMAIVLMAACLLLHEAVNGQRIIQYQPVTLADVVGSRSVGVMRVGDRTDAQERLGAWAVEYDFVYSAVKRDDGRMVATYEQRAGGSSFGAQSVRTLGRNPGFFATALIPDAIEIAHDIRLSRHPIETSRIVSGLERVRTDFIHYVGLVVAIAVVSSVVALLICSRLNKLVSDPILQLRLAMQSVFEKRDYSVRIDTYSDDDFGVLAAGFNHMLEQMRHCETELARFSSVLSKEVAARTSELTAANRKRILWLETMARFLRHELKNSTVGVKTSLDLIERRVSGNQPVDVYLARARKSMANMNTLLTCAGDASTLEATVYKEPLARLDFSALIHSQVDQYASIFPHATVISDCRDGIFVLGNGDRLVQMLDKLVSNAVEHSGDQTPVTVSLQQRGDVVQLVVYNRGVALPEDKERLFDLFVSMRSPERKTDENCGLGLYIVKIVAESHGGRVAARDLEGGIAGAVFTVTLPTA